MDFKNSRYKKAVWLVLVFGMGILMLPLNSPAESNFLTNFSFDDCDPFEARARIMDVNGKKALLVAAEQTIYVVDWSLKDQHMRTELTDADGDPMDFGSFRRGQWIHVKGFKHIDGGVVASMVQQIDSPERKRPVLRKINKENRQYKRIKRRVSGIKN
jgi:hypothetical protein